jgi:hypothetical protein
MPFILFESKYEGENNAPPPATTQSLREVAYQTILGGGAGHVYGNRPVWNAGPGWKQALDAPGATELLPNIKKLFESRVWYQLVPDQDHSVVTGGYTNPAGIVPNALTANGATLIAYLPNLRTIVVDLTKITGPTTKAWWFNPRNGTAQLIGNYPDTSQPFTSPDNNDWVLVLDDASLNLPAPGEILLPSPTASPSPLPVIGDLDGDTDVDYLDVLKLITSFNPLGSFTLFDFNGLLKYFGTSL